MADKHYDIIIIGGGTAGMTAAIYARRAGKSVLLLEGETLGGQISASPRVENYPGIPAVSGMDFSDRLFTQVTDLGADFELDTVTELIDGETKTVVTSYGRYTASAVIAAVGLRHRRMGLPMEEELIGRGISFCAVCDGAFYKGADVAVYGGGNTALQEALFLADICNSVTVIHRRAEFRADKILVERVKAKESIRLLTDCTVTAVKGNDTLEGITATNVKMGAEEHLAVTGLFVAIGQLPRTEVLAGVVALDERGFVLAGEDCKTDREGIFAAGDCRTKEVRQLTTAVADGACAALAACRYLETL